MTGFVEPNFEERTQALKRDFENREFVTDFSVSIQQLASFVSNFGTSFAFMRITTFHELSRCGDSASLRRVAIVDLKRVKVPFSPFSASSFVFAESAATSKLAALDGKLARCELPSFAFSQAK